jgi:DNA-directed RNA polymerase delta subunit
MGILKTYSLSYFELLKLFLHLKTKENDIAFNDLINRIGKLFAKTKELREVNEALLILYGDLDKKR